MGFDFWEIEHVPHVYVTSLILENIRSFKNFSLNVTSGDNPRMMSVMIGRNGTCKSTLLRCIALGLGGQDFSEYMIGELSDRKRDGMPSYLVTEGAIDGTITLRVTNTTDGQSGEIFLAIAREGRNEKLVHFSSSLPDDTYFTCGYGVERGVFLKGETPAKWDPRDALESLFYPAKYVGITEFHQILSFLGESRFERALKGIKRALGLGPEHRIHVHADRGIVVSGPGFGESIPLQAWADGYRLTFAWMVDALWYAALADAVTEQGGIRGVLLVDEIEQHLHPSLQANLPTQLQQVLPEMQIFLTTHSPVVALNTRSDEIIALHRKGEEVVVADVPPLTGYTAEDVLIEEALFGTDPYSSSSRAKISRYHELTAIPPERRTGRQSQELRLLVRELHPETLPGLREEPILKKVEELIKRLSKDSST